MNNLLKDITEHFLPNLCKDSTDSSTQCIPYWLKLLLSFLYSSSAEIPPSCVTLQTQYSLLPLFLLPLTLSLFYHSFRQPPSFLTPLPPASSSPRLVPNGGIPLQPPGLVLLFCSGRAHFMQHDYISLPAIRGRISQSVLGLHKCIRNLIKSLHILPCSIDLPISRQLRT